MRLAWTLGAKSGILPNNVPHTKKAQGTPSKQTQHLSGFHLVNKTGLSIP